MECIIRRPNHIEDFSFYFKERQFLWFKATLLIPVLSFKSWRHFRLQHYPCVIFHGFVSSSPPFQQAKWYLIYPYCYQQLRRFLGFQPQLIWTAFFLQPVVLLIQEWKQDRKPTWAKMRKHLKKGILLYDWLNLGTFRTLLWKNHLRSFHAGVFPSIK